FAQVTDGDIARADAEYKRLQDDLDALSEQFETLVAKKVLLERSVESRSQTLIDTTLSVESLVSQAQNRAADMYMDAALSGISRFLAPTGMGAGAGFGYLEEVAKADRSLLTDLEAQKDELER